MRSPVRSAGKPTCSAKLSDVLGEAAREVTTLIGDGCVIRVERPETRGLAAVAADHRDPDRRRTMRALLGGPPVPRGAGWLDQAIARGCSIRLPSLDRRTLRAAGLPGDDRIGDALVVPIGPPAGVIIAIRDRISGRYSTLERTRLARIAGSAGLRLGDGGVADREGGVGAASPEAVSETVTASISAGVWMTDDRGETLYVNEMASELVGAPAQELVGVPVDEYLDVDPAAWRGGIFAHEVRDRRLIRADGSLRWVSASSAPLFDQRGERRGAVLTLVDVDARKRREIELRVRLDAQRAVSALAERLVGGESLERCLTDAVTLAVEQLDLSSATLSAVDREAGAVSVVAAAGARGGDHGLPAEVLVSRPLPEDSPALAAIEAGGPVVVRGAGGSDGALAPLAEPQARCAACVPIAGGAGMLVASSEEPDRIDAEDVALLESIARLLSSRWPLASDS